MLYHHHLQFKSTLLRRQKQIKKSCGWRDSNPWPLDHQPSTLPLPIFKEVEPISDPTNGSATKKYVASSKIAPPRFFGRKDFAKKNWNEKKKLPASFLLRQRICYQAEATPWINLDGRMPSNWVTELWGRQFKGLKIKCLRSINFLYPNLRKIYNILVIAVEIKLGKGSLLFFLIF